MKSLLLTVPCLLVSIFSNAQLPKEKTLLWKVEGNGLAAPSYLYGTIHIMCPDDITVTPSIRSAFDASRQLYLEMDLDDPMTMAKIMMGITMKDGSSLKTLLSEQDYDSASSIFTTHTGLPLEMLARSKPMLLLAMLYPSILGCAPEGWEQEFMKMAKEKNMDVLGLERAEDQIAVLDSIPYKVQAEMFLKTVYNLDSTKESFNKMVEVYKKQDIQEMVSMTSDDESFGTYEQVLLRNRNRNWIPVMAEAMEKKPTFFAVGAAHLAGEDGVITLLRRKGYSVTAVK